jgi:acyl-CoA thioesterase FadM
MDPNGHINNVAYLAWALEVIPDDVCHDHQLKEVSKSSSSSKHRGSSSSSRNGSSSRCHTMAWSTGFSFSKHPLQFQSKLSRPKKPLPTCCTACLHCLCLHHVCLRWLQVEMDFKAECTAGDEIDCFGMSLTAEGDTSKQQFLHLLRKGGTETEVWRARTTWVPVNSSGDFCSSSSSSVAEAVKPLSNGAANNGVAAVANGAAVPRNGTAAAAAGAAVAAAAGSSLPSSSSSHAAPAASSNGTAAAAPASDSSSTGGGLFGAFTALFGQSAANKSDN